MLCHGPGGNQPAGAVLSWLQCQGCDLGSPDHSVRACAGGEKDPGCDRMLEQGDRCDRRTELLGNDGQVCQRGTATAPRLRHAHSGRTGFEKAHPGTSVEARRFGGAGMIRARLHSEEVGEDLADGLLVGREGEVHDLTLPMARHGSGTGAPVGSRACQMEALNSSSYVTVMSSR